MLKERIRLPYPWIKIHNELEKLLYKLSVAEDEEESELFLFRLYIQDAEDLSYFTAEEQEMVRGLLTLLMEDTRRHTELIAEMSEEIKSISGVCRED